MSLFKRSLSRLRAMLKKSQRSGQRRIVIHGMNYAPEIIGVGKYTTELAEFLAMRGYAVEVITAGPHYPGWVAQWSPAWSYTRCVENGVRITRCPLLLRKGGRGLWRVVAPLTFALAAAPVVVWRLLRDRPSVLLCVEPTLFSVPAAVVAAKICGARTVLQVQDLEVDAAFATAHLRGALARRMAYAAEGLILSRFDAVVTISDAMARRLAAKGVPQSRLSVIRNWVDFERLRVSDSHDFYRAALGLPMNRHVVLYAGHLGAKQDVPCLVKAVRLLAADPAMAVVVAGEGPMAHLVAEAAVTCPNVYLLPLQPARLLGDLLAMADVHLLPQDAVAADLVFPSKLGPMLASGKPVVVTANPGTELATWLDGAATLVRAGDSPLLADAVRHALTGVSQAQSAKAATRAAELDGALLLPAFECLLFRAVQQPLVEGHPEVGPETPWDQAGALTAIAATSLP